MSGNSISMVIMDELAALEAREASDEIRSGSLVADRLGIAEHVAPQPNRKTRRVHQAKVLKSLRPRHTRGYHP